MFSFSPFRSPAPTRRAHKSAPRASVHPASVHQAQRALAAGALVVTAPTLATAALIVAATGQRPLFRQQRVGQGRHPFVIYKLRTMRNGEVTPIGHLLRRTGIDELPQLLNVLKGEMALVGPRPLTAEDVARLGWTTPTHDIRWRVRPGLTGLAQLHPKCDRRLTWLLDRAYAEGRCTTSDAAMLMSSGLCLFIGKQRTRRLSRLWRRARHHQAPQSEPPTSSATRPLSGPLRPFRMSPADRSRP